jgi:hypothetical protein
MLVVKHYFLTDFERIMTERAVRKMHESLTDEDIYALDDRELMGLHDEGKVKHESMEIGVN